MKWFLFLFFTSSLLSPASAAEKSDYWYKVEPKTKEEKKEKKEFYPYDSLEAKGQKQQFREVGFWSRGPKLTVGLGYFFDKEVF
ncbi:MAG: hypothetical protein KDD33_01055 [Bdellovibrionales bacterium]|nr:hypothetical protein [Bdellovibrionales bacterium]